MQPRSCDDVCRSRHVAAVRELPARPTSSIGWSPTIRCTHSSATTCFLVQLQEYVKPGAHLHRVRLFLVLFDDLGRRTRGVYCEMIKARLNLGADSLVVEIASNDGYLLQHFLPLGVPVLGIEPAANVAEVARRKNIPTLVEFFGLALAQTTRRRRQAGRPHHRQQRAGPGPRPQRLRRRHGASADAGRRDHAGVPASRAADRREPVRHHLSRALLLLLAGDDRPSRRRHGLKVFDVEKISTHGGSLRVYLCRTPHADARGIAERVSDLLAHETSNRLRATSRPTRSSPRKVHHTKRQLLSFLIAAARNRARRICGYGAPGKGNTLLNYCGIGTDFLDFTVDRNPYKHGRFTPGHAHPDPSGRGHRRGQAGLPPHPALEPEERDRRARCATSAIGAASSSFPSPRSTVIDPTGARVMKVVLFCGGLGTRIRDYSESIPKPMIPVGHQPILWHVMQYYSQYGHRDFVLCLGYKANVIKEFFLNYRQTADLRDCVISGLRQEGRAPRRAAAGLARHAGRHRHLAQHRPAPAGGARASSRTRRCSSPTTATG